MSGPPTLKELLALAAQPQPCPLCKRTGQKPSDHHLVPKSRGGRTTETLCVDCHRAIHTVLDNKSLEREYSTVEALMSHEVLAKMIHFIAQQDGKVRMPRRKKRGR
jgi:hypothetical protein